MHYDIKFQRNRAQRAAEAANFTTRFSGGGGISKIYSSHRSESILMTRQTAFISASNRTLYFGADMFLCFRTREAVRPVGSKLEFKFLTL